MKSPFILRFSAFAAVLIGLGVLPVAGVAEDLTPPVLANRIADLTVAAGTKKSVINLKDTFGLDGVTGTVVRMATVEGNIDIEVLTTETPKNAANFLGYVNSGYYNGTFIHRLVPGFVFQGGGYYIGDSDQVTKRTAGAAVIGEHVRSNTRGTIAFALSSGPDSATDQWFFNIVDNTMLDDTSDGGPFTVFGRVIEGDLKTVDAIAALPDFDFSASLGSAFNNLPLFNYDSTAGVSVDNLVYVNDVVKIPLIADTVGADAVLALKVKNTNPALVTAKLVGHKLKLIYADGQTGTASIKVLAKDSAGTQTKSKFTVTVQ